MTDHILKFPKPFASQKKAKHYSITFTDEKGLKDHLKRHKKNILIAQFKASGFTGAANQGAITYTPKGTIDKIFWGVNEQLKQQDGSELAEFLTKNLSADLIKAASFEFTIPPKFKKYDWDAFARGWALAHYDVAIYNAKKKTPKPVLVPPKTISKKVTTAHFEAITLLRNLVNTPPNKLGTDELASVAKKVAQKHKAKIKIIRDKELIKKNFPMIYDVGKASTRPPQLVDITWGKKSHPKVTIVGKGIIYDTGGLNLKPGQFMRDMKKDMGGAAHALGVTWTIMALNLPIQLRVLLPIAENAVAGNSYRPGDILNSRKGITVEICDTDAEGRLVLADALTYACEEKPDLLIDFATLTGAARVGVGYDIPAFFSNRENHLDDLRHSSLKNGDPCWPFPLWEGYDSNLNGDISDIRNEGTGRAGHIEAALFLQRFIDAKTDWIHLDCFAWEQNGRPGRPKGGADTGMYAIAQFIKDKYA